MILMYVSVAVLMNCACWKAGLAVLTGTVHIPFSLCKMLMYMYTHVLYIHIMMEDIFVQCLDSVLWHSTGQDVCLHDHEWCSAPCDGNVHCGSRRTSERRIHSAMIPEQYHANIGPSLWSTGLCIHYVCMWGVLCKCVDN